LLVEKSMLSPSSSESELPNPPPTLPAEMQESCSARDVER
jgi:hypothetical protein